MARHAGVPHARLDAHSTEDPGGIEVTLTDDGNGFDPATTPAHKRGVSTSIVERMTAVGGTAYLDSTPGHGTTVRWIWHG
ncbi:ATP-binding protein [Saccharomonospora sp. CUA-673]|uniref:ATP-binding protein n=1 Tax=Saccharomonospora sp. CUA-673 TaxID=1904969 RepID=UPI002101B304|nr:ATP-binding protein [Saccharomonospora sp. CUA-673]